MNVFKKILSFSFAVLLVSSSISARADSKDLYYLDSDKQTHHGIYFHDAKNVPDAAVLFVHGMQSHAEWVRGSGFGDELAEEGIDVFAFDRRGSGKTKTPRGHTPSAEHLLVDMENAVRVLEDQLQRRYGSKSKNIEIHIMANCFGARIVVPYLVDQPEMNQRFASLILIAPSTHMTKQASYSFLEKLGLLAKRGKTMVDTPLEDEWFVSKGEGLEWIQNDKNGLREVSVRFLKEAKKLTKIMNKNIHKLPIPLLIMTGQRDVMVKSDLVKKDVYNVYPAAKRYVSLNSEHSLEFGEAYDKFVSESVDWLSGSGVDLRDNFAPQAIIVEED